MSNPIQILSRALGKEEGEDPIVEWKAHLPRGKDERKEKERLARTIVALSNSAAYHGAELAYLFIGIERGRIVGIKPDPEDQKTLADILKVRTLPLLTDYTLKYYDAEEVKEVIPNQEVPEGIYCITIEPPRDVPLRYKKGGKELGGIVIRHGSEVAEADPFELRDLYERIEHGPAAIIDPEDREVMSEAVEEAGKIANHLKLGDRKSASRLAYKLLLHHHGRTHLFHKFQFSPALVLPLIERRVNPFSLLITTSGYRTRFKMRLYPRSVRRFTKVDQIDTEIQAWEDLRVAYSEALEKGLPRETTKILRDLDFHDLATSLRHIAKRVLTEASKKEGRTYDFWWIGRSFPLGISFQPPKDWIPEDPPFHVDGVAVFSRTGFRFFGPSGIQVHLPILTFEYEEQNIVWWAIFLDGHIFLQITMWAEAFPFPGWYNPWEREPSDMLEEGRLSWEEYAQRISRHEVRLSRWPMWALLGAMTLFSLVTIVTEGPWWPLAFTVGLWAFYISLIIRSRRRRPRGNEDMR